MNALSPDPITGGRLARLIPRLATDSDGEVLATVAAIRRTLDRAGMDLHDLAARLTDAPQPVTPVRHAPPETWRDLAAWCVENSAGRLGAGEYEFVRSMAHRLAVGGLPSDRQAAWLRAIYSKLRGAAQ